MAEQQRLAELKRTDPGLAQAQIAQATQKRTSIMPDQTRDVLKRLAETMRRANGAAGARPPARRRPAPRPSARAEAARAEAQGPGDGPGRRAEVPRPVERPRP